jgi:prepilin-type N-terminal cleavage/methylation domain-containing protein/prepilin-type processing-associated H-X9-DG protein
LHFIGRFLEGDCVELQLEERLNLRVAKARQLFPSLQQAFSLIELLVTISILAILTTVAFLGAGAYEARVAKVKCASNLRTLGSAIGLYTADNAGRYPGPIWVTVPHDVTYRRDGQPYHPLTHHLAPYLGLHLNQKDSGKDFELDCAKCPSFERHYGPPKGVAAYEGHYQRLSDPDTSPFGGRRGASTEYSLPMTQFNVESRLKKPMSKIVALYDLDKSDKYGPGFPIHSGGRNYLFLDGHVEWVKGKKIP